VACPAGSSWLGGADSRTPRDHRSTGSCGAPTCPPRRAGPLKHLAPHRDGPDLGALDGSERDELAHVYLELFRRLDRFYDGVDRLPYIAGWHQAPVRGRHHLGGVHRRRRVGARPRGPPGHGPRRGCHLHRADRRRAVVVRRPGVRLDLLVVDTRASHRLVDGQYAARRPACADAAVRLGVTSLREGSRPRRGRRVPDRRRRAAPPRALRRHRVRPGDAGGRSAEAGPGRPDRGWGARCPDDRMTGGGFGGSKIATLGSHTEHAPATGRAVTSHIGHGAGRPAVMTLT